jgi:hypothetical protein
VAEEGRDEGAQLAAGEAAGQQPVDEQGLQQGVGAGSPNRSPGMRVPARVMTGAVRAVKARAPAMGSWLTVWAPSRRRLAAKPICRRSGRLVSRLGMPKSA